ncbi:16S rRNA (guanine(966)-N(2))-methyltransferase RsmD [Cellvibrio sp. ARAG 10.3]|uniref:16S rRNA (guanine(966)-N(2))-methyltransferase RsmD n=1 Tax=Cellvibrio sp. ARAG 10.3 TaxID=3451358 RepID=UPI003F48F174
MKPPAPTPAKSRSAALRGVNQLRIIGGQWRGRKLGFPDVEGLRPTGDRIRETLFNWLAPEIRGARCLDLFAGSGALGLEALSRGAGASLLVERDAQASAQLRANLALLQAEQGSLLNADALTLLRQGNSAAPFNVVFVDPPFQLNLWQAVVDALEVGGWLADESSIYIESGRESVYQVPSNWSLHRDKQAGQVNYRLFYRFQPA